VAERILARRLSFVNHSGDSVCIDEYKRLMHNTFYAATPPGVFGGFFIFAPGGLVKRGKN
jgi:hypothetical protein